MFKLSEKYEIDRRIQKCDYIRYSPSEISTINTPNSQIYINIPREDSVISLLNSYIELNFDVLKAATSNRYADTDDMRLINTPNSQIYINIPREDSVISLLNSYIELNFDVLKAATSNRYADTDDMRLINLGPIALFSNYKLTSSSGKHLENIDHAHIVSLMYKLLSSS